MNNNDNAPIPVGFRFHPTDEELVGYYLHGKVGRSQRDQLIQELDLYKIEPWDLHEVCRIGDDAPENQSDWYFFSHKDKKYPTGNRANRATTAGFWKATGRDKPIHTQRHVIGMRKTLVFYKGRAPHGQKTDWIMHEFRLDEGPGVVPNYETDGWVVCRVFRKTKNFKTKSQDTSCSFEEDQHAGNLLPELMSPTIVPPKLLFTSDGANPGHLHHHFNFSCKQEISVDDYGTHIIQEPPNSAFHIQDPSLHHLQDQLHRINALAPCSSSTFRALTNGARSCRVDQGEYSVVPLIHVESSSLKDFDDARSSLTHETSEPCFPVVQSDSDYWRLEGSTRRDQTLADVTCHVGHLKRHSAQDHLSSSNHENTNLIHLWNNVQ
ncbi:hypothetical protein M758_1G019400 [Ceratodon purpureus]|uniref:NAC domain-containing protein n=1 Tax=Ceratodon purpureus TaxID=3225 RepID=A0A8T0J0F8_CERPU|nr:hypothetical protein KC19_1G020700 [Ceratodon purpureus]KAG0628341.1 hypothetical protein M758_1G019400 [Ceratodon purpureus]